MKYGGVCIILENKKGDILLLLRDDKPSIPYPNQWITPGGRMEEGETPEEAIRREMMEEMELNLGTIRLVKTYEWPEKTEYVYHAQLDIDPAQTPLHEGQEIRYFSREQIASMHLAFHDDQILKEYFS